MLKENYSNWQEEGIKTLAYICDRCGKVIPRPEGTADEPIKRIIDWGYAMYDDPGDGGTVEQIDVCPFCYSSFLSWKARYINEKVEEKEDYTNE